MAAPTVSALVSMLGSDLTSAEGFALREDEVSAVHVSELRDPTAFLAGGELLLTTGLTLGEPDVDLLAYALRLRDARVAALGLGLGPVFEEVPVDLAEACRTAGVSLLVVPALTPFTTISRVYWSAVARSGEEALLHQLAAQRELVDAASSEYPGPSLLRSLVRAVGGWAATITASGDVSFVYPPECLSQARALGQEARRLGSSPQRAVVTLAQADSRVVMFPHGGETRASGLLAVGTRGPLDSATRRTVLIALALLDLANPSNGAEAIRANAVREDIATLIEAGKDDAATMLAAEHGWTGVGARVCALVVRTHAVRDVLDIVHQWCSRSFGRPRARELVGVVVPERHPDLADLSRVLLEVDPASAWVLSEPTYPREVAGYFAAAESTLGDISDGSSLELRTATTPDVLRALARLPTQERTPIMLTLAAYLRHRGRWDPAAHELGVHRNTLRRRIERAQRQLDVDLNDPDIAAHLWLALRNDDAVASARASGA